MAIENFVLKEFEKKTVKIRLNAWNIHKACIK